MGCLLQLLWGLLLVLNCSWSYNLFFCSSEFRCLILVFLSHCLLLKHVPASLSNVRAFFLLIPLFALSFLFHLFLLLFFLTLGLLVQVGFFKFKLREEMLLVFFLHWSPLCFSYSYFDSYLCFHLLIL